MNRFKTVNADYRAAVNKLLLPRHPDNGEAQKWLSAFLKRLDWASIENPSLWGFKSDETGELPLKLQIGLLKSCLELMVRLREQRKNEPSTEWGKDQHVRYDIGGVVYGIAIDLFRRPLPFSERDICGILETARHDCGHGGDVTPPFDLALNYAREHDLSVGLLAALRVYVDGLKGLQSIIVQGVKRKAALVFTLDNKRGKQCCWSQRFRDGVSELPQSQQKKWRAMVLQMDAAEFGRNEKHWKAKVPQFIETFGAKYILVCLSAWWPSPVRAPVCPIETGGSYLLQHFVWLLDVIAQQKRYAPRADSLIVQLSKLDWKPRERGQKVVVAAARYLERRPPVVGWSGLQALNAWSESFEKKQGFTGSSISKITFEYGEKHGLSANRIRSKRRPRASSRTIA
jgi:hypothetical protein